MSLSQTKYDINECAAVNVQENFDSLFDLLCKSEHERESNKFIITSLLGIYREKQ